MVETIEKQPENNLNEAQNTLNFMLSEIDGEEKNAENNPIFDNEGSLVVPMDESLYDRRLPDEVMVMLMDGKAHLQVRFFAKNLDQVSKEKAKLILQYDLKRSEDKRIIDAYNEVLSMSITYLYPDFWKAVDGKWAKISNSLIIIAMSLMKETVELRNLGRGK